MNIEMITNQAKEINAFLGLEVPKYRKNVKVKTKVCETSGWVSVSMSYGKESLGCTLLRFDMFESGSDAVKKENVLEKVIGLIDTCFRCRSEVLLKQTVAFALKGKK